MLPDIAARRICLIKPSALGDVVQTLPALSALRERYPDASISWVINQELAELLEGHPHLDEVIRFNRRGSMHSWLGLFEGLREREFDLVFDLQGLLRTALMMAATRAPVRVGLQTAREGAHLVCHCTLPNTDRGRPAHSRYWRVAEAVGMGDRDPQTVIPIGEDARAWALGRFGDLSDRILAVHPGARWMSKRWPVEKFAVVACKAMRLHGFSTVIVGSAAERDVGTQLQDLLRQFVPNGSVLNLTGETSLIQLAAVLQACNIVLTNDSGPMHLAAGLGTPVLGVFTCTSPVRSGPPGDQHELIATTVRCAARYKKRCPKRGKRHLSCMEELSTQRACEALARLIGKAGLERDRRDSYAA